MRPVSKGARPKDQYTEYAEARGELIQRLGEYCSYCEQHLDSSLAVEHVRPKKPKGATEVDMGRALDWDNFLLACVNCNSTKGNKEVALDEYLWPDTDNTFRALKYSADGTISPNSSLDSVQKRKAENIIKLTGLDKQPPDDPKDSDRRWRNRRETRGIAARSKNRLATFDTPEMREQIVETAQAKGYWSMWMTVFEDDADMCKRFLDAFPGTCRDYFDENNGYAAIAQPGGQC